MVQQVGITQKVTALPIRYDAPTHIEVDGRTAKFNSEHANCQGDTGTA